jgi:uncharacterized protein (TIGR03032 family)
MTEDSAGTPTAAPEADATKTAGREAPAPQPRSTPGTDIGCSAGFAGWMARNGLSLAFSSYQSGQLFLAGRLGNGQVSFHQHGFGRAMGLWANPARLYLATSSQIWRLENVLRPGELANDRFDRLYVPRNAQTVGGVDIHEIAVEPSGRILFVNTSYSCLATLSITHGFRPLWKPPFISKLAPEDRCHLNGLGMENGRARYVTAVCRSDVISGWRDRRAEGGMVIDLADDDRILTDGLSMPHSPRIWREQLYVLDSGRGYLCRVDRQTGAAERIAFLPGFLRGLAFAGNYAIATLSLPRDRSFSGLELDEELKGRDGEPWCGVQVVDLTTGDVVQWIRLTGVIRELFDVTVLPGARAPMSIGGVDGSQAHVSWEAEFGSLFADAPAAQTGGAPEG